MTPASQDPYATWDTAYALGALDEGEAQEYRDHTESCPDCHARMVRSLRAAVALTGLPPGFSGLTLDTLTRPGPSHDPGRTGQMLARSAFDRLFRAFDPPEQLEPSTPHAPDAGDLLGQVTSIADLWPDNDVPLSEAADSELPLWDCGTITAARHALRPPERPPADSPTPLAAHLPPSSHHLPRLAAILGHADAAEPEELPERGTGPGTGPALPPLRVPIPARFAGPEGTSGDAGAAATPTSSTSAVNPGSTSHADTLGEANPPDTPGGPSSAPPPSSAQPTASLHLPNAGVVSTHSAQPDRLAQADVAPGAPHRRRRVAGTRPTAQQPPTPGGLPTGSTPLSPSGQARPQARGGQHPRQRWQVLAGMGAGAALLLAAGMLVGHGLDSVGAAAASHTTPAGQAPAAAHNAAPAANNATPASSPPSSPAAPQPMAQLLPGALSAMISLIPKPWGTRLEWSCTYPPGPDATHDSHAGSTAVASAHTEHYVLVVTQTNGTAHTVAAWRETGTSEDGMTAMTDVPAGDISAVEIRTASGTALTHLDVRPTSS